MIESGDTLLWGVLLARLVLPSFAVFIRLLPDEQEIRASRYASDKVCDRRLMFCPQIEPTGQG